MDRVAIFNDSFDRCLEAPGFFDFFYKNLTEKDNHFKELFLNVDMARQIRMLKISLYMIMLSNYSQGVLQQVDDLGERHGKCGIKLTAQDYVSWMDSLMEACAEFDPTWDENTEEIWREMLEEGVKIMVSHT